MKFHNLTQLVLVALCALLSGPVHAANKPTPLKVGATAKVDLEANQTYDFAVPLGKGAYRLVWDAQRIDGQDSNIIAGLALLKPNGAIIDSSLLNFNETEVQYRIGRIYNSPSPFTARFRIKNGNAALHCWFTVAPVAAGKRVPFGWGAPITPARISSDNGVGGELEPLQSIYHSITLPKGKWSISLGLQLPDNEDSNLMGSIDRLDVMGFAVKQNFVWLNETDNQARQETILTVTKPTPMLLRVTNGSSSKTYTYDVTIAPEQ